MDILSAFFAISTVASIVCVCVFVDNFISPKLEPDGKSLKNNNLYRVLLCVFTTLYAIASIVICCFVIHSEKSYTHTNITICVENEKWCMQEHPELYETIYRIESYEN